MELPHLPSSPTEGRRKTAPFTPCYGCEAVLIHVRGGGRLLEWRTEQLSAEEDVGPHLPDGVDVVREQLLLCLSEDDGVAEVHRDSGSGEDGNILLEGGGETLQCCSESLKDASIGAVFILQGHTLAFKCIMDSIQLTKPHNRQAEGPQQVHRDLISVQQDLLVPWTVSFCQKDNPRSLYVLYSTDQRLYNAVDHVLRREAELENQRVVWVVLQKEAVVS